MLYSPQIATNWHAMNTSTAFVRALLAYSVHEHQIGATTHVNLVLGARSCTLEDNGRGIGLDRDGYVVGLVEQLAARGGEVALHGLGLAIIAVSSQLLAIESRRAGRVSTQTYSWGVATGPVRSQPTNDASGTRVTFTLPSEAPAIDEGDVLAQVEVWRAAHPNLRIDVQLSSGNYVLTSGLGRNPPARFCYLWPGPVR